MKVSDYRDMYCAISNGIDIGVTAESVLEEVVAERKRGNLTASEYDNLVAFFKECDYKNGAHIVQNNSYIRVQEENRINTYTQARERYKKKPEIKLKRETELFNNIFV